MVARLTRSVEINTHNTELDELVHLAAPRLVAEGVSRDVAAKLLIAAGDNPERIRTEFGFAALWREADPSIIRQNQPSPIQPIQGPSQQCTMGYRDGPPTRRPRHPRLAGL